jgi:hypothetical protein
VASAAAATSGGGHGGGGDGGGGAGGGGDGGGGDGGGCTAESAPRTGGLQPNTFDEILTKSLTKLESKENKCGLSNLYNNYLIPITETILGIIIGIISCIVFNIILNKVLKN